MPADTLQCPSSSACKTSISHRQTDTHSVSSYPSSATQDMILPLHTPITAADGTQLTELAVPRGTEVIASLRALNRAPAYWGADALEWRPARFLAPLPAALADARVPGIYSNMRVRS